MFASNPTICIIGLGYVGLPLAVEFGKKTKTIGFDINQSRIDALLQGVDHTLELNAAELSEAKFLSYCTNEADLKNADVYIVTVPTPINDGNQPDLTPLEKASALLGRVTLINVWASWCKPCREEMPGLDSLRRAVRDSAFLYVSVNGDVSHAPAESFLRDVGLELPFAIAGPGVTRAFRAPGLPYTALLDRDGRIVQRWLGYSGADQMTQIRAAIRLELGRQPAAAHAHHGR